MLKRMWFFLLSLLNPWWTMRQLKEENIRLKNALSTPVGSTLRPTRGWAEAPGCGWPDWPVELRTYSERLAYQRGVADARNIAAGYSPLSE